MENTETQGHRGTNAHKRRLLSPAFVPLYLCVYVFFCISSSSPLLRAASKDASILGSLSHGGRFLIILLVFILLFSAMPAHAAAAGVDEVFGKLSLTFERNEGQADPKVKFLARARGYSIFLTGNETVMKFTA